MPQRDSIHDAFDSASIWCLRILAVVAVLATCALAATHSPRLNWMALAALLTLLLNAVNHLRIRAKFKSIHATAIRHRRKRGAAGR